MSDVYAFPLCWPDGWPRTPAADRRYSRFKDWSAYSATTGLAAELERLGGQGIVVSSSVPLRRDGLPTSQKPVDGDPGAAVYWSLGGGPQCMACDLYNTVGDNLRAITLCIEALRTLERHGGGTILDRAFMGFSALPGPGSEAWRDVLGVGPRATLANAQAAYRALAKGAHPDAGGSDAAMARLNAAWEAAQKELS